MNTEEIKTLIEKYYEGKTSLEEEGIIYQYFSQKDIAEELKLHQSEFEFYKETKSHELSENFDDELLDKLEVSSGTKVINLDQLWDYSKRVAASLLLIVIGFTAGHFFNNSDKELKTSDVNLLRSEVQSLKTMMTLTLLEQKSAHERLRALSIASELENMDTNLTSRLISLLNTDKNVNIRLAAAETLLTFSDDTMIRDELVKSIPNQSSILVQLQLLRVIEDLGEEASVPLLRQILEDPKTGEDLKNNIEEILKRLIK